MNQDSLLPELGVIGTGRMGSRLAAMFAQAGRRVVLGSRDIKRSAEIVERLGLPTLRAGTNEEAAAADAVLPAVFMRDGRVNSPMGRALVAFAPENADGLIARYGGKRMTWNEVRDNLRSNSLRPGATPDTSGSRMRRSLP